jgi:GNAT superfamily N-acetyltransferase
MSQKSGPGPPQMSSGPDVRETGGCAEPPVAYRGRAVHEITAVTPASASAIADLLRRAGFGSTVGRLLDFPFADEHGAVFGAGDPLRPAGTASCASFGATGWIGALGVEPSARRQGLGSALTQTCIDWLRGRGAQTVLLYATEAGRPIYERLGFVAQGTATAWRGQAPSPADVTLRPLRESDREALVALDRELTGERRDPVLDAVRPLRGLCRADGEARLDGYAVASVWGAGVAILAREPASGMALLSAACSASGPATVIVPDTNEPARAAMSRWTFTRYNTATRMHLGPPPVEDQNHTFGLFNLFWG